MGRMLIGELLGRLAGEGIAPRTSVVGAQEPALPEMDPAAWRAWAATVGDRGTASPAAATAAHPVQRPWRTVHLANGSRG